MVIGEPRTERIREAKNLKFVQMTWAGADIYTRGGFPQGIKIANASGAFGPVIAEYVIGATGPLTGDASSYGNSVRNGAQLAVDEINAAGGLNGVNFKFDMKDDKAGAVEDD